MRINGDRDLARSAAERGDRLRAQDHVGVGDVGLALRIEPGKTERAGRAAVLPIRVEHDLYIRVALEHLLSAVAADETNFDLVERCQRSKRPVEHAAVLGDFNNG